jgi:hypothetical protein
MREIVALSVFMAVSGITVYLSVNRKIDNVLTAILLIFSLVSGWSIANFDWLSKVRWEMPGIAAYEQRVNQIKEEHLEEITKEIASYKESLGIADSGVNAINEKMDLWRKDLELFSEKVRSAEESLKNESKRMKEESDKLARTREQIIEIYLASSQLALSLTRVAWFQIEVGGEPQGEKSKAAVQQLLDELDVLVGLVIEDPQARAKFVSEVMGSVPAGQ